jgi:hypothetical protein
MSRDSQQSELPAYARTPDGRNCWQTPGVPTQLKTIRSMGLHIDAHTRPRRIEEQRGKKEIAKI